MNERENKIVATNEWTRNLSSFVLLIVISAKNVIRIIAPIFM